MLTPNQAKALIGVAIVAGALALGFGGGWTAQGWRLKTEIAEAKAARATEDAAASNAALTTLKTDAEAIHKAAGQLAQIEIDIGPQFAAIKREIKNAKPLPVGCAPDAVRVRNLDAAIDTANAAIARAGARGAVPPNP